VVISQRMGADWFRTCTQIYRVRVVYVAYAMHRFSSTSTSSVVKLMSYFLV
jgi:hypothetical protein